MYTPTEISSTASPGAAPIVSGASLAKILRNLGPVERAALALDLAKTFVQPTLSQAATMARAAEPTARKLRRQQRAAGITTPARLSPADLLVAAWYAAGEQGQQEFTRQITPEKLFDTLTTVL
jgi:hypothetical protein